MFSKWRVLFSSPTTLFLTKFSIVVLLFVFFNPNQDTLGNIRMSVITFLIMTCYAHVLTYWGSSCRINLPTRNVIYIQRLQIVVRNANTFWCEMKVHCAVKRLLIFVWNVSTLCCEAFTYFVVKCKYIVLWTEYTIWCKMLALFV